ncbi:esterase B1-like [Teleopsis dalmanni]|uniref:esterase B1-like n=1 Tax=Teleopsis dalmanni TaxID=139649 RepID=UPI0018CE1589|nr:esterase B1-like [Teleopsis dalmanni]XP_037947835.1 esterase B1-like [Teleopsis dalmanni]XP_037953682.1 esterase B1-like [Teleopsis dalmanni]
MSKLPSPEIIVYTNYGPIQGLQQYSIYNDYFYSFEGIPYARPPIGELRFKDPLPPLHWSCVKDCTRKAEKSVQQNKKMNTIVGNEDCLFLNIYTKAIGSNDLVPVMLFIHGGGFDSGSSSRQNFGPDYFMMEKVVLVTINYRVGALGFLSLKDPELDIPGNAGLRDQLMALEWVRHNISKFSGNPYNITLFGESAGAASIHFLMMAPAAKCRFRKAILQSGTALAPWAINTVENAPFRLAQLNGFTGENNDKNVLDYLRNLDAYDLVRHNLLTQEEYLAGKMFSFGPVIEPYHRAGCIISKHPRDMLSGAWGNRIPIIIGNTSFEGLLYYRYVPADVLSELHVHPEYLLPEEVRQCFDLKTQRQIAAGIKKMHFGREEISLSNILRYCELLSFKFFLNGTYKTVEERSKLRTPTFLYRFDFDSPDFNLQRIKYLGHAMRGVAHTDDRSYLFYSEKAWKLEEESLEFKTIKRMISMWTMFAYDSNPNNELTREVKWLSTHCYDYRNLKCLNISDDLIFTRLPELPKLRIWRRVLVAARHAMKSKM